MRGFVQKQGSGFGLENCPGWVDYFHPGEEAKFEQLWDIQVDRYVCGQSRELSAEPANRLDPFS